MKTKIGPDIRKPFRGLTTIQLFDKNTGELVEEYHDENTYNDRLQYINYLDTILKCKNSNISSKVAPFTRINDDTTSSYNDFFFEVLSNYAIGDNRSGARVRQSFATLWLTNNTKAETAHGYPNGFPVGIADTAGVNSKYASYACSGILNMSESYVGNDRLHLVFDFATDKCNVQFDALWLFPSTYRFSGDLPESYSYNVTSFYQAPLISSEVLDTQLLYKYTYFSINYRINGNYSVLGYNTYRGSSNACALQILNNSTGEIVSTIELTQSVNVFSPMYYNAGTNTLYLLRTGDYRSPSNILNNNTDVCALYKLNMSSGTITKLNTLYNMLGLRWSDFNAVTNDNGSEYTFVSVFKKDGNVAIIFRLRCLSAIDSSIKNYFVLFNFDPATETFVQVKKFEVFDDNAYNSSDMFMVDNMVYITSPLNKNQKTMYKYSAFDINTGAIKNINIISISSNILSNIKMSRVSGSIPEAYVYLLQDQVTYRRAICSAFASGSASGSDKVADCNVVKQIYFTAPWSTHNKLTSAIKKTNMTTMKIQYDIIWDNITEKIIPQLM